MAAVTKKNLLIIATLDTKGREAAYLVDCCRYLGASPRLMDIGTLGAPEITPEISRRELAHAAGQDLEDLVSKGDRPGCLEAVREGGIVYANRLLRRGLLDGVMGLGGGTGTAVATAIMRSLPFGIPKMMVSTVASRDVREYVGTRDIVMVHSVADLLGFNGFVRLILGQAAHAVCGMMERGSAFGLMRPMVAVTAYGINSACAALAEGFLLDRGYEMIGFHANGCGGMAMEDLVAEGRISGILDLTPHEIADEMYGGYCRGIGPARFETAGRSGIPLVFAPGGLDNAVFSPVYPMPGTLEGRRIHRHDTRFCVRMEAPEMEKFARIVADKLNRSAGPNHVLIPTRGWSEADREGMELFDPEVDQVFTESLRKLLNPRIPLEEMDVHISDPLFARRAVEVLCTMMGAE